MLIVRGMVQPGGLLRYPFLVAAVMAGWFLPQAFLLLSYPLLPKGGYSTTMLYASICMIAILIADSRSRWRQAVRFDEFDERKLLFGAAILSAIGTAAYALILRTPATATAEGLTTGIVTVYFFFAALMYFGLALSLLVFLRRRGLLAGGIVVYNLMTIGGIVLWGGRRGPMVELAMIVLCAIWFRYRIQPPRAVFAIGILVASLFFNAIGQYRSLVVRINEQLHSAGMPSRLPTLEEILQIDFLDYFVNKDDRRHDEVRNAINYVSAAFETSRHTFGLEYWNYLVFRYIPAQFVGRDLKNAVTVDLDDLPATYYGYQRWIGTTYTGFADSYTAFSFLGALVFAGIAVFMRNLWHYAMLGSIQKQYFYCICITSALHAITHGTVWLIAFLPQAMIFSYPIFRYARLSAARHPQAAKAPWSLKSSMR